MAGRRWSARGWVVSLIACSLVLAACGLDLSAFFGDGVVPAAAMTLEVSNQTTVPVDLVVNGTSAQVIDAGTDVKLEAADLPPLPWATEVRLVSGRTVLSLTVHAGDVQIHRDANGTMTSEKSVGTRVDLSCGRIDLWSGAPLLGPVPGPGKPGDCV